MELEPQDLLVLLKVAAHPPQRRTYAALGEALAMSASEAHASVKRAVASGLAVAPARGEWSPVRPNLLEFLLHGVRYIWPATSGPVRRGVPTSFGAAPLAGKLMAAPGEAPVWADPAGTAKGPTLSPLYRTAPQAAMADPALQRLLALLDALRTGRARERTMAAELMQAELMQFPLEQADARNDPNLPYLRSIAEALGELRAQLVFVGGAVAGLLVTDPLADSVRATRDVDAVVNADRALFRRIEKQVAQRGFVRDVGSDVICRWVHKPSGVLFDLMPVQPEVLVAEMAAAPADLRQAVGAAFARLLADPDFANVLPGLIAEPERAGLVLTRLRSLIS